jgi:hypothetical protein
VCWDRLPAVIVVQTTEYWNRRNRVLCGSYLQGKRNKQGAVVPGESEPLGMAREHDDLLPEVYRQRRYLSSQEGCRILPVQGSWLMNLPDSGHTSERAGTQIACSPHDVEQNLARSVSILLPGTPRGEGLYFTR